MSLSLYLYLSVSLSLPLRYLLPSLSLSALGFQARARSWWWRSIPGTRPGSMWEGSGGVYTRFASKELAPLDHKHLFSGVLVGIRFISAVPAFNKFQGMASGYSKFLSWKPGGKRGHFSYPDIGSVGFCSGPTLLMGDKT